MVTNSRPTTDIEEPSIDDPKWANRRYFTPEERRELFDGLARHAMGMSGEEFLRRWDAGEFHELFDHPDHPELTRLVMRIPVARQDFN